MYFPILINWTSPFPILGLLGGIFHFYSNFKRNFLIANSGEPDQTPRFAASDLVLHCLPLGLHECVLNELMSNLKLHTL